jgi:hypothetical protein
MSQSLDDLFGAPDLVEVQDAIEEMVVPTVSLAANLIKTQNLLIKYHPLS